MTGPRTAGARQPLDRCPRHQQFDLVVADLQSEPEGQFSVDPAGTVGAPGGAVHGTDLFGQPPMTDGPR